jgi:hypothetical protein
MRRRDYVEAVDLIAWLALILACGGTILLWAVHYPIVLASFRP